MVYELTPQLLGTDGSTLLTDKDAIYERLTDYFNGLCNRRSTMNNNPAMSGLTNSQLSVKQ